MGAVYKPERDWWALRCFAANTWIAKDRTGKPYQSKMRSMAVLFSTRKAAEAFASEWDVCAGHEPVKGQA